MCHENSLPYGVPPSFVGGDTAPPPAIAVHTPLVPRHLRGWPSGATSPGRTTARDNAWKTVMISYDDIYIYIYIYICVCLCVCQHNQHMSSLKVGAQESANRVHRDSEISRSIACLIRFSTKWLRKTLSSSAALWAVITLSWGMAAWHKSLHLFAIHRMQYGVQGGSSYP